MRGAMYKDGVASLPNVGNSRKCVSTIAMIAMIAIGNATFCNVAVDKCNLQFPYFHSAINLLFLNK